MADDDDLTECIDDLIDATSETETLLRAAADYVPSEEARVLVLARAQRFGRAAIALCALRIARGAVSAARPRTVGAPRTPPTDETAILAECERLETAVIVAFRDVLELKLPATERAVIARVFESLLSGRLGAACERPPAALREIARRPV